MTALRRFGYLNANTVAEAASSDLGGRTLGPFAAWDLVEHFRSRIVKLSFINDGSPMELASSWILATSSAS
jgi:hypothetical protein